MPLRDATDHGSTAGCADTNNVTLGTVNGAQALTITSSGTTTSGRDRRHNAARECDDGYRNGR